VEQLSNSNTPKFHFRLNQNNKTKEITEMLSNFKDLRLLTTAILLLASIILSTSSEAKSISELSQHFNEPGGDISPWMFIPEENIKKMSTTNHPGMIAIWENGKGQQIKGILKDPIRIDEYALPWEFHMALVQNAYAMHGVGFSQSYAIGLNVAVTFSDPSTWPKDRTKQPPDTRWIQLLVVHLGDTTGMGPGLPQYVNPRTLHETYLVWGRGDLGYGPYMGDWQIPYNTTGDLGVRGGPASDVVYFRLSLVNPNWLQLGIRFLGTEAYAYIMKDIHINVGDTGSITGIWEIGPVFVCDRWIPDVLCPNLPLQKGWHIPGDLLRTVDENGQYVAEWNRLFKAFEPQPPNPLYEYFVDHCVFFEARPQTIEEFSEDFEIPGFMPKWQAQSQGTLAETYSNPGYLTITMPGSGFGTGVCPISLIYYKLDPFIYEPPWEIECAFIGPDDKYPWNFRLGYMVSDQGGTMRGTWSIGVQNFAEEKRHRYINMPHPLKPKVHYNPFFTVQFEEDPPESIMSAKPLYMLMQVIDPSHIRVGFRAKPEDPWYLSKVYDVTEDLGGPIGGFSGGILNTATGGRWGGLPGHPTFERILIDYMHYRYGLSTSER
jgi:hypothetical protein